MIDFIIKNWIEIIGSTIGILYLYFEYKANILMWATGILMSSFYTIVFIQSTFYAFAAINIYYIIVGIYGWITWSKAKKNLETINITHTPPQLYIPILISIPILFGILSYLLKHYTNSHVIYGDSLITTLSIVSLIMLVKKYAEQWILLIVVNLISVYIYYEQELYPTSIMYLIYTVASIFGYIYWKKMIKPDENVPTT